MSGKFRILSVFLVATLIVVAGCTIMAFRANAQTQTLYRVLLRGRHQDSACSDVGTILVDGTSYALPATLAVYSGVHQIQFPARSGCDFVMWEVEGGVTLLNGAPRASSVAGVLSNGPGPIAAMNVEGDGTLRVVYRGGACCFVGGVVTETNTFTVVTPYLVAIGLIATTTVVAIKKRRN